MSTYYPGTAAVRVAAVSAMIAATLAVQAEGPVDFNRDVRTIISDKCFACHGPDEATRKKGLRLDTRDGLFGTAKGGMAVVAPGDPAQSALIARITHADPGKRMPPEEAPLQLSPGDVETLTAWILQGAPWQGHWAFEAPKKPALPAISDTAWPRNEIDYFVLHKLEEAGLTPGPEARKETLIRRVSLDLTGLPPTPAEVDAFLADDSEKAYEKVVDRLLASPQYGERMAFPWLDAARYSDTNGYQRDTKRFMWAWRDWVIQAFNDNMPFDQFTIEQLAGDLLPGATLSQRVATGFNRNHRINGEGGIIPEEYAVEYVVDRVDTTSTTWMGLTMGCARCHDHKFDPILQREFYELYAFFDQVPEEGKGRERGNDKPFIAVPTPEEVTQLNALEAQIAALKETLAAPDPRLDPLQEAWETDLNAKFAVLGWASLAPESARALQGATLEAGADGEFRVTGANPDQETYEIQFRASGPVRTIKLDVLTDPSLPETGPGRSPNGNVVISEFEVERAPAGAPGATERIPVMDAFADFAQDGREYQIPAAIDGNESTGWATGSHVQREDRTALFVLAESPSVQAGDLITVRIKQTSGYAQHAMGRFRLSQSPSAAVVDWARPAYGPWHQIGPFPVTGERYGLVDVALPPEAGFDSEATYEGGSLRWEEKPEFTDGVVHQLGKSEEGVQYLHRTVELAFPQKLTLLFGSNDALKVWIDGRVVLVANEARAAAPDQDRLDIYLPSGRHDLLLKVVNFGGTTSFYFNPLEVHGKEMLATFKMLASPPASRTDAERDQLRILFRSLDPDWLASNKGLADLRQQRQDLERTITTTMVMEDMPERRDTYLLKRGAYDAPDTSEKLYPSVPARLGEMKETLPKNRLGLAQWLVDPAHPLTARVRVNHYWQMYFGKGIVRSSEDFGIQGTPPTHPELLDWLAVHFIDSGWDVKAMQKTIVMSATYRQSSVLTAAHREKDPENILLGRAPKFRLPAEVIRDQALKVSGLLNPAIGGPSVYPYQPEGMWSSLTFQNMDEFDTNFYVQDTGDKLYRRGLYTYWKRTIAPPRMQIFDAADRERCSMGKPPTNTPMQALALLNDPTFVEAARHLAERMVKEGGARSADRIRYGYRLALACDPSPEKQEVLLGGLSDYQTHFASRLDDAAALLGVGDSDPDATIPDAELAAYTAVASVMLNLDEIITRK